MYYSYLEDRAYEIGHQDLDRFNGSEAYNAYMKNREYAVGRPVSNQLVLDADSKDATQQKANQRILNQLLSINEQQTLHTQKLVHFRKHGSLGVAVYFPKKEGDFIVIVTLNEHLGDFLQNHLSYWLIAIILLSAAMEGRNIEGEESISWTGFLQQFVDDKRITLKIETGKEKNIQANPYLLKMAMQNIVRNALKYSKEQVIITLADHYISISDHGIGIPKNEIPLILQPFYRASNTQTYQGNGIGMSLSAQIFKLYGIKMMVRSKEGIGTTILLNLN